MRVRKYCISALMIIALCVASKAMAEEKIVPGVYAFGMSASFSDSTVYITDIQWIDSVWMDTKTGFILERGSYSNQLRNYLSLKGVEYPTCIFFFDKKMKKLGKKFRQIKEKYVLSNRFDVKYVDPEEFSFKAAVMYNMEDRKAKKEKAKKEKKQQQPANGTMGPPSGGGMGGPGGGMGGPGGGMGGPGGMGGGF